MKDLISKPLHIGMTLPQDFGITVDTEDKFVASGSGISVSIQPYILAGAAQGDMASALIRQAESLGYTHLSNAETIELNGFKGCYVTGSGKEKTVAILLMHQQRKQHLFILISYPAKSEKLALYIANSFYAE